MNAITAPIQVLNDVYKNSIRTNDSLTYTESKGLKVSLRRHQHAVVEEMKKKEADLLNGLKLGRSTLYSKYAILGDSVGVGKTLMVLSHILSLKDSDINVSFSEFNSSSNRCMYSLEKSKVSGTVSAGCLIVVPHTLFRQWSDEISSKTTLKVALLKTRKNVSAENFVSTVSKADVILVSNTLYKELYNRSTDAHIRWKRIYIDEADSIELVSNYIKNPPNTNFMWFITASFMNLLFPQLYSIYISSSTYERYKESSSVDTELNELFLKNTRASSSTILFQLSLRSPRFYNEIINANHILRGHLVIRCSKEFIEQSIQLPPLYTQIIVCKPSLTHNIVYNVIGGNIQQLLNGGDVKSALDELGVKSENNTSLIEAVTEHKTKELDRLVKTYDFKQGLEYSTPQIKEQSLKLLQDKIANVKQQITNLKERIENYKEDVCPICYDDINDPLLTHCCNRVFCAPCILKSLIRNPSCPLCRIHIEPSSLKKITNDTSDVENSVSLVDPPKKKVDKLFEIMQANPEGKFLIFSRFDNSFIEVKNKCNQLNMVAKDLKGSKDMIASMLKQFKDGSVNCLCMNTLQMAAGLNITEATHVFLLHAMSHEEEKQILGRAYRVGRTKELHFIKLYYPQEVDGSSL